MKERVNVAFKLHLLMLILGFTWGMIVSAISPANASGELNLGLGLLYNMMWIPFFWGFMFTGVMKTLPPIAFYVIVLAMDVLIRIIMIH